MLDRLIDFLSSGGLLILFILLFLEGNPIFGSFIPGQMLTIFAGILISTREIFNLYIAIFVVFFASFLGDLFGFYLGKKLGVKGLSRFGISEKSSIYKSSSSFFKNFGVWSIILGRQFNLTRAFMPFLAGVFSMGFYKFLFFAFLSNVLWVFTSLMLGYYFGHLLLDKIEFILTFTTILIIYLFIIFLVYKSFKKFFRENSYLIREYAIHSIISIGTFFIILILFIFIYKFGLSNFINESFNFFLFVEVAKFFYFLISPQFLIFCFLFLLGFLFYKKEFRLAVIMLWGFLLSIFVSMFLFFLLRMFGLFVPYVSIMFLTIFVFYIWILISKISNDQKNKNYLNFILIIILFFAIYSKATVSGDFFRVIFSFFMGALICEFLIILSHYKFMDKILSVSVTGNNGN